MRARAVLPRLTAAPLLLAVHLAVASGQSPQNPSPMVEHTREHPRLPKSTPPGERHALALGSLFLPEGVREETLPLLIHFHGGGGIAEVAAAATRSASLTINAGSGSAAYAKLFAEGGSFRALREEAEKAAGRKFGPITLSGWSAGCGAIREILREPANDALIDRVVLIDGIHAGYTNGAPGPLESSLETAPLAPFVRFARRAMAGEKRLLVTHSEIFPGTFASTTETADWLLREVDVERRAVLKWGPMKTQQLSEARAGSFAVLGFAGNSPPDHVDQLHALPDFLSGSPLADGTEP